MLIRFNVGNFLSFNENQEFSMIAGNVKTKPAHVYDDTNISLLKFSALYGANASGKSSLISAIDFAQAMVVIGFPEGHISKYFRGNTENKNKESYFEFEFSINGKYYSYGFEVILSKSSICSEWLFEVGSESDREIFSRNIKNGTYSIEKYFQNESIKNRLDIYASDIKYDDTVLFIKLMNTNKVNIYSEYPELKVLSDVYKWIENCIDVNFPNRPTSISFKMVHSNIADISKAMMTFGTGITNMSIVGYELDKAQAVLPVTLMKKVYTALEERIAKNCNSETITVVGGKNLFIFQMNDEAEISCSTVEFNHQHDSMYFDISEESDGTIRLLELIDVLLSDLENKTYFIDEIDRCLHPQLTYRFIETFLKHAENKNIQLIVTTHESRLLDFELLRRDEVWFAEKNQKGESSIYSLDEYNERFDKEIDRAYLEGRYGGIPQFGSIPPHIPQP